MNYFNYSGTYPNKATDIMVDIVERLNSNGFIVDEVTICSNEISIRFNVEYHFTAIPEGFFTHSFYCYDCYAECNLDGSCSREQPNKMWLYYKDDGIKPETPEQFEKIINDLKRWLNKICRPIF